MATVVTQNGNSLDKGQPPPALQEAEPRLLEEEPLPAEEENPQLGSSAWPQEEEAPTEKAAAAPDPTFECVVERQGGVPWGIVVEPMHPYLVITRFAEAGAFASYNAGDSEKKVELNDVIIRANGAQAPQEMINLMQDASINKLELLCSRPQRMELEMQRQPGEAWGFVVEYQSRFNGIVVKSVEEVKESSNIDIAAGQRLIASDLILAINCVSGNPASMKAAMKAATSMKLSIIRVRQ